MQEALGLILSDLDLLTKPDLRDLIAWQASKISQLERQSYRQAREIQNMNRAIKKLKQRRRKW